VKAQIWIAVSVYVTPRREFCLAIAFSPFGETLSTVYGPDDPSVYALVMSGLIRNKRAYLAAHLAADGSPGM